jgi:carbonic anhydrase
LNACVAANVSIMCEELRNQSEILRNLERNGNIVIAGGVYNVASGSVEFTLTP